MGGTFVFFFCYRSRRLTFLGKKFGCVGVVILLLGRMSEDGLTASWWRFASSFVRVNVEGGIAALAASLLPYPRFATRDGALRAQVGVRLHTHPYTQTHTRVRRHTLTILNGS